MFGANDLQLPAGHLESAVNKKLLELDKHN